MSVGNGYGDSNFSGIAANRVTGEATMLAAKTLMDQHDCQGALKVLENFQGGPMNPETAETPEVAQQRQLVFAQAMQCTGHPMPRAFLDEVNRMYHPPK